MYKPILEDCLLWWDYEQVDGSTYFAINNQQLFFQANAFGVLGFWGAILI